MEVNEFLTMQMMLHIGCISHPKEGQLVAYSPNIGNSGLWKQTDDMALYMEDLNIIKIVFGELIDDVDSIDAFNDELYETFTFIVSPMKLDMKTTESLTKGQVRTMITQLALMVQSDAFKFPKEFDFVDRISKEPWRYVIGKCTVIPRQVNGNIMYDWVY